MSYASDMVEQPAFTADLSFFGDPCPSVFIGLSDEYRRISMTDRSSFVDPRMPPRVCVMVTNQNKTGYRREVRTGVPGGCRGQD